MERLRLSGRDLSVAAVAAAARAAPAPRIVLDDAALRRVGESHALLHDMIADGRPIYGITTGFGALDGVGVAAASTGDLQRNLLMSHAAGVGPVMPADEVRAMMLIRANVLAGGMTGVSPATLDGLLALLNAGLVPEVPTQGSVGACGDLAPLAHMALPLIGAGRARAGDAGFVAGGVALAEAGLAPLALSGRDGIALINGTEQTTGIGCLALADAARLVPLAEAVAALTLEALGALDDSFDRRTAEAKPHPGQLATSAHLARLTAGSTSVAAPRPSALRDALSLRCVPQVLGAARDSVAQVRAGLEIEINAANDNPLFTVDGGWVTSNSGNFHGQRAAELLDYLANSLTSLAVISERRAARLVDPNHNGGLPAFLIHPDSTPGVNSGYMIAQYTAAALIAELRCRSVPAAIQSVPTCGNTEDHVPMAPLAAARARFAADSAATVVAIELLLAAQALAIRGQSAAPALRPLL